MLENSLFSTAVKVEVTQLCLQIKIMSVVIQFENYLKIKNVVGEML